VDEYAEGEVSPYLVRETRPGDQVEVRGPIGRYFVWPPAQAATGPSGAVQLIAGGSGIVPLMSIVRAHHAAGSGEPFRLLYSVRTPVDALYADELPGLVDDHFRLDWVYTRQAPTGANRPPGRVDAATIAELTLPPDGEPLVYVCGPTGFVE
jgi:ferredoxin-NADP reductase